MQIINVDTCKPVHGAQVDVWQANALGVYSDKASGYLRGWQPSSIHGTVDFDSIFPGHYSGRATHIHIAVKPPKQDRYSHRGMIYFDEYPRQEIEKTAAYQGNKAAVVPTIKDNIAPYDVSDKYDPFAQWSWLGNKVGDGILGWIAVGVNLTDSSIHQPPDKRSLFDDHLKH